MTERMSAASMGGRAAAEPIARIEQLSVGFEADVVLRDISFEIPRSGLLGILGPAGVGKSTLLRTLGRWNDAHPSFWKHGHIWFEGRDLLREMKLDEARRRFALLAQKARLYTATILENVIADASPERPTRFSEKKERAHAILAPLGLWDDLEPVLNEEVLSLSIAMQRKVSLARLVAGGAAVILADEPLRDISTEEADSLGRFLARLGERLAIVMVTHNQKEARELCQTVCLLSDGRVVEIADSVDFFEKPSTELGARYLEFGNCWPSSSDAVDGDEMPSSWRPDDDEKVPRPSGFHWVLQGLLGGMQQPGLLREIDIDARALRQLGCRRLITLTEGPLTEVALSTNGIAVEHFPIPDMDVPSTNDAIDVCDRISRWVDDEIPTVLHCKAGLGRTGTMLACVLVYRGENAVRAIEQVRSINPHYIQSEKQLAFVSRFASALASHESPQRKEASSFSPAK